MKAKQICSVILALLLALSALTIAPAAAEGWDGETATAPAGSGTQDDPYLVSSAANLLWMSQNIKKGDTVTDAAAGDGYGPSFADAWFEQTEIVYTEGFEPDVAALFAVKEAAE